MHLLLYTSLFQELMSPSDNINRLVSETSVSTSVQPPTFIVPQVFAEAATPSPINNNQPLKNLDKLPTNLRQSIADKDLPLWRIQPVTKMKVSPDHRPFIVDGVFI